MTYDFDLFVIGGGSAGVRCGRIAATHGARVAVAEERFWGGTCVNVGCVPKKLMVQAAEYGDWAEDAVGFGWTQSTRGPHDWSVLAEARDREVARLSGIYDKLLAGAGCKTFDARATLVDAHTVLVDGQHVTADKIVIAVGGTPQRAEFPGCELGLISDDLFTLKALPRRVVVIGSGFIALEFACLLRGLGAKVELVYRQALPLRGFDEDIRPMMAEALAGQGITLHPETSPTHLVQTETGLDLTLTDGTHLAADAVFLATGRVPHTGNLGLAAAGVHTTQTGAIIVDDEHATSQKNIFAIGDVTDRINLTPMATAVGHALADTLCGKNPRKASYRNVPSAVFTMPPVSTVGLTEDEAAKLGPADIYVTRFTPMRHTLSKRARRTLMKLVVCGTTGKVLGAHMMGEDAPEIMQGLAVAIVAGATKADFDRTIGIHPTAAEEFVTLRTRTRRVGETAAAAE